MKQPEPEIPKIRVSFSGWDDPKVVLEGRVFELRDGPQRIEARIVERGRRRKLAA